MGLLKNILFSSWLIAAPLYAQNNSDIQTISANAKSMYQEYEISKLMYVIPIAGSKSTYFKYTPMQDTVDGQLAIGVIEGATDMNIKVGPDPEYDLLLRTYINESKKPIRTITLRRNQLTKDAVSNPKDLEIIAKEKLNVPEGEKITEFSCEIYMPISGDEKNKLIRNMGTDSTYIVPRWTMDFLSVLLDVINNPRDDDSGKVYLMRHFGKSAFTNVFFEKDADFYRAKSEVPSDIEIPLAGGSFDYYKGHAPFHIEAYMKYGIPVSPSADAKNPSKDN